MSEDFCLHLATFPSNKSKKSPNGWKKKARYRFVRSDGSPRQYRIADKTDMTAVDELG